MKKTLFLLSALLIFSCSSDDSNDNNSNDINSDFVGTWTAIYSGDGSGSAEVIVSSSGSVSGYADETDPISGTLTNEGSINATSGNVSDGYSTEWTGTLQTDGTGSGTWSGSGFFGTWTAIKQ